MGTLNCTRKGNESSVNDDSFPHLIKPRRLQSFQMPKNRLKRHKYEEVDTMGEASESWSEDDNSGQIKLPQGWQRLKSAEGRMYYWHVPSGRTQFAIPCGDSGGIKVRVCDDVPPSISLYS